MAVNMKPTTSAFSSGKAGSLLMRPTQVASVNDVEEPEKTLDSVTAVAPAVAPAEVQEEPVVTPQEPPVTPSTPAPTTTVESEPEVPVEEPVVMQGIEIANEQESAEALGDVLAYGSNKKKVTVTGDVGLDYDHPLVKEEIQRKKDKQQEAYSSALKVLVGKEEVTEADLDALKKQKDSGVTLSAEDEYEDLENRSKRSFFGYIETPRYLAAVPGLFARLVDKDAKDSESKTVQAATGAYSAAVSSIMDVALSKFIAGPAAFIVGDGNKGLYDKAIVEPVINGRTVDQKFENDLLSSIKKRTGKTLTEDYLKGREYVEAAQEGAATFALGGFTRFLQTPAKQLSKQLSAELGEGAVALSVPAVSTAATVAPKVSKTSMATTVLGEGVKGAATSVGSVYGSNLAINLIDPKSKEGQILAGMAGGFGGGVVSGAAFNTTSKVSKYSPTAIVIRGSKVAFDKAVTTIKDIKREKAIGDIMRDEGVEHKEAIRRYYNNLDSKSPEKRNLAMKLLNETELTHEERMDAVNQILTMAFEDPYGREAEVVRNAITVINKDKSALTGAWSQAELLSKAFEDSGFQADVFDVYEGKYKEEFLKLREQLTPDDILVKQKALLEFMQERLAKDTELTELERTEMTTAAKLLEKSMDESIKNQMVHMQQMVAANLDYATDTAFNGQEPLDTNVNRVRTALTSIKTKARDLLRIGYSAIDSQNKVRSTTAFSAINEFITGLDAKSTAYKEIQKAYSSLMADATMRHRDTSSDTSIIAGTKVNPTTKYSKGALKATNEVVYLNPQQFEQLTGVVLKEGKPEKPLTAITSLELTKGEDGSFTVAGSKGADVSSVLGKDTLIPVSLDFDLLNSLVDKRLRIKDPTGAVVVLDLERQLGKVGDDRHNIALMDHTIEEGRRRGNLSQETAQASFLPKFDISRLDLTYKEMDQFQRTIRRLRKDAWNRDDNDAYMTLKELDHHMESIIQEALKNDPTAYNQRKSLDYLYGDSFIPELQDPKSLVGKATTRKPTRTYSYAMSSIIEGIGNQVELRQQLLEALDPSKSKFIQGIMSKASNAKLDKLMGLDKQTMKAFEADGRNLASSLLDIKMTDLLQDIYKNIGSDTDPRDLLIQKIKDLQDTPDFVALMIAAEGTPTHALINKAISLPDDADFNQVIDAIQHNIDNFDTTFYRSIRGMKDPANTKAVLDIMANLERFDQLEASLIKDGQMSAVAPHMVRVVLTDILQMGEDGISTAKIQQGINKYGASLKEVPGGPEALRSLEQFRDNQDMLNRLNASVGKAKVHASKQADTDTNRRFGYLNTVFSNIQSAKKGIIGMDYAVFASITGIASKELRALHKAESKAISEVFAAALTNKELFDKLQKHPLDKLSPADRLKSISLLVHGANGVRLGALEAVSNFVEISEDTEELLEALRKSPEYAEVEAEDAAAEQEAYGNRPDGTPKGPGFLGELKTSDGQVMTEFSFSVDLDGKEVLMPAVVPTLSKTELKHLQETQEITPAIERKAIDHAIKRIKEGKSPFYEKNEDISEETDAYNSSVDPMHEVDNLEGPITDGMSTDMAAKERSISKFQDLRSQGIPKEQVLKTIEALGMADNNNRQVLMSALEEAYKTEGDKPSRNEEN